MKSLFTFLFVALLVVNTKAQVAKLAEFSDSSAEPTVFSIDHQNRYLAIGNELGILSLFSLYEQSEVFQVRPHSEAMKFIAFRSKVNEVVTASENEIIFTSSSDGSQQSKISLFENIELLKLSPQTDQLFILARIRSVEVQPKQLYKVDLASRKYDAIQAGSGIDDIDLNFDGSYLFISRGSKILTLNINLNLVEGTLKGDESGMKVHHNASKPDWLASNSKLTARYWNLPSERSYTIKWSNTPESNERIDKAWVLEGERRLLLYGKGRLKIKDLSKPNGDIKIHSSSGLEIETVRISEDASMVIFRTDSGPVEIWNLNENETGISSMSNSAPVSSAVIEINNESELYKKYKIDIDKELNLRSELFKPQGEFERSTDYEQRQKEAEAYKKKVFDYYKGVATREIEVAKKLEAARLQILADRKKEDSLRKISLYRDKIVASYEEFYSRISSVGTYNPDREFFPITIDEITENVRVPFDKARDFKEGYLYFKVVGSRQLLQDGQTLDKFNYRIITDNGEVYYFGKQHKPLFVADDYKLFNEAYSKSQNRSFQEDILSQPPASNLPANRVDASIVNYFKNKKYHALIIGVNDYKDYRITQLDEPINDAQNLKTLLNSKYTFDEENITLLKNPSRTEIIESFDYLQSTIGENDNLLIFYAGHGIWDENLRQGFWLPSDSKVDSKAAWLSNAMIRDYIGGINAKHTLLVADACFSGGIFKSREVFVENRATLELAKLPSRKAITSGTMKTVPDKSVFIEYLLKRLEQNSLSLLPTEQLFSSFKIAVMNNSQGQVPQYGDIQGAGDEGGDFVFVRRQ